MSEEHKESAFNQAMDSIARKKCSDAIAKFQQDISDEQPEVWILICATEDSNIMVQGSDPRRIGSMYRSIGLLERLKSLILEQAGSMESASSEV